MTKKEKHKRSYSKNHPDHNVARRVIDLATFGIPQKTISQYLGMSDNTLRKHYQKELDEGMAKAHLAVAKFIFMGASGEAMRDGASYADCQRSAIFYAKTQMGWKETNTIDHTSTDGSMSPSSADFQSAILESLKIKHYDAERNSGN